MSSTATLTEAAQRYQALGLPAIPVRAGHPLVKWERYQQRLPAPDDMVDWPWHRADGLAVVCGHRDPLTGRYWWVLDIEPQYRAQAEAWLDDEHPGWHKGLVAESQRGGLHIYCLSEQPVPTGKHPWGDVKGVGGLAFAPPSKAFKPDAKHDYQWLSFQPEEALELEPTDLPWPDGASGNGHQHWEPLGEILKRTIPVGQRNVVLTRVAGWLRGEGQLEPDEVLAVLRVLNRRCEEPLPDEELQDIARSSGRWSPNPVLVVGNGHRQSPVTGLSDSDSDDAVRPVAVWELPEPAPREWLLADLLPADTTTLWYGDDGSGKSLLALALSVAVAAGLPFLGRPVQRGPVLYVDTEFAADEFQRRAYQLARGMGLGRPPEGLWYVRTRYSLSSPGGQRDLARLVEQLQPVLVVVDSLTLGTWTDDLKEAQAAVAVLQFLESLGTTVLALDHIPKNLAQNQAYARPWGSFSKRAKARHAVLITQADAGGVLLRVTKSNVARPGAMVGCSLTFAGDRIVLEPVALGSDDLAGIDQHLPPLEQVYQALVRLGTAGPDTLAAETGLAVGTVKNKLTALRRQGRAEPLGDGRWRTTQPASLVTRSKDSDRDDDPGSGPSPSSLVTHSSDSDSDDDPGKPNISHHDAKIGGHDLAGKTEHGPGKPNISDDDAKNGGQSPAAKTEHDPGKPNISDADAKTAICEQCGNPFAWSGRGKPARYCSDACRMKATRQRQYPQTGQLVNALTDGGGPMENLADVLIATGDRTGWPLSAARLAELTGVPWDETQPVLQALLDGGTLVSLHGDRRVMTHTVLARPGCRGWTLIARTLEGDDGQ